MQIKSRNHILILNNIDNACVKCLAKFRKSRQVFFEADTLRLKSKSASKHRIKTESASHSSVTFYIIYTHCTK